VGVLGISWAIAIPFAFAIATIFGALGILYGVAQLSTTPTYATTTSRPRRGRRAGF